MTLTQKEAIIALAEGKRIRDKNSREFYFDNEGRLWYRYIGAGGSGRSWVFDNIQEVVG